VDNKLLIILHSDDSTAEMSGDVVYYDVLFRARRKQVGRESEKQ